MFELYGKCDMCKRIVADDDYRKYTIKWDDEYFTHSTNILLCKSCARNFHENVMHCKWKD